MNQERDYTPEIRRLFLSGIEQCETMEQARHEWNCIVDLIPEEHPLKIELVQKLQAKLEEITK